MKNIVGIESTVSVYVFSFLVFFRIFEVVKIIHNSNLQRLYVELILRVTSAFRDVEILSRKFGSLHLKT